MNEDEIFLGLTIKDMKEAAYIGIIMACISFTAAFIKKVLVRLLEE